MHDGRIRRVDGCFALASALALLSAAARCRLLRAIACVDRTRERQPIVSLIDRFVRLLKCSGCRGEAFRCVLLRACGSRAIDCLLRSIDFFLRRFRARHGEHERARDRAKQDRQARHQHESIAGYGVR